MGGIFSPLSLYRRSHHASSPSLSQLDKEESLIPLIDESRETEQIRGVMDLITNNGMESEHEFWPIEHPIEPLDEDQPVKCPMPDSSVLKDGSMNKEWFSESLRKRGELPAAVSEERMSERAAAPVRAVRKRHHTLTHGDYPLTPLLRMPTLPAQNISVFHMFQQLNK